MKEFDLRKEAKKNAEFITPEPIRKWFAEQVNSKYPDIGTVFDPCCGSGQLMQYIKAKHFMGNDINEKSVEMFKENFENSTATVGNYFEKDIDNYDIAVSNYPFSLNAKDVISEIPEAIKPILSNGKITGKADWLFIINSFLKAKCGGFYLCFPGISYRSNEQKYRDYLIENNYVERYGKLINCKFEATSIDLMYLELAKDRPKGKEIEVFEYDFDFKN